MPTDIVILAENLRLEGYLTDTPTAKALADALPFEAEARLWGAEIYFPVPKVVQELDDTAAVKVDVGDLAYWPSGKAFCIFFRANARASNRLPRVSSPIVSRPRINRSTISSRRPSGPMKRC